MDRPKQHGLQEPSQIRYLVSQGCIKPLCDILKSMDNRIIQVALDGLENLLKVGESDKEANPGSVNQYALHIEECVGMVTIHQLQHHENLEIYKKCCKYSCQPTETWLLCKCHADDCHVCFLAPLPHAVFIMDKYFPDEDDAGADTGVDAPQVDSTGAFDFQPQMAAPSGGFSFAPSQQ